jgi:hypothetical protein
MTNSYITNTSSCKTTCTSAVLPEAVVLLAKAPQPNPELSLPVVLLNKAPDAKAELYPPVVFEYKGALITAA